jgi:hypothetical protein
MEQPPRVGEVSVNFCDGSPWPYSRICRLEPLLFLSSSSSIVLTRLSGPRTRPTIRKSDSAGNRTRTSGFVARNTDHQTTEVVQILSSALCFQIPSVYAAPFVSKTMFTPIQNTGKIIILNILIFTFFTAGEKTKGYRLNGSKHYPNSISSCLEHNVNMSILNRMRRVCNGMPTEDVSKFRVR